jgi:hypothetical protein
MTTQRAVAIGGITAFDCSGGPPGAVRLLILEADGSVPVHDDAGGYEPLD